VHSGPAKPTSRVPAWPGVQYRLGDRSTNLKKWQLQMRKRGFVHRDWVFGLRHKYVKQLQRDKACGRRVYRPEDWRAA